MKTRRATWMRTRGESRIVLLHYPLKLSVRVCEQSKYWSWIVRLGNNDIALGEAATRQAGETAGIANVKELVREIERACPWQESST